IVMAISGDPVGSGLVKSFARPGGNVTGTALAFDEVSRKWLEMLIAVRPRLAHVVVVSNPTNVSMKGMLDPLGVAARGRNLKLTVHEFGPGATAKSVSARLKRDRPDGLIILPDAHIRTHVRGMADAATRARIPAVSGQAAYAEAGVLM